MRGKARRTRTRGMSGDDAAPSLTLTAALVVRHASSRPVRPKQRESALEQWKSARAARENELQGTERARSTSNLVGKRAGLPSSPIVLRHRDPFASLALSSAHRSLGFRQEAAPTPGSSRPLALAQSEHGRRSGPGGSVMREVRPARPLDDIATTRSPRTLERRREPAQRRGGGGTGSVHLASDEVGPAKRKGGGPVATTDDERGRARGLTFKRGRTRRPSAGKTLKTAETAGAKGEPTRGAL